MHGIHNREASWQRVESEKLRIRRLLPSPGVVECRVLIVHQYPVVSIDWGVEIVDGHNREIYGHAVRVRYRDVVRCATAELG